MTTMTSFVTAIPRNYRYIPVRFLKLPQHMKLKEVLFTSLRNRLRLCHLSFLEHYYEQHFGIKELNLTLHMVGTDCDMEKSFTAAT